MLYGDEHNPYPRWDGPATVANVRAAVRRMAAAASGPDDRIAFIASSHGAGDGRGNSYLQILEDPYEGRDASERSGQYHDRDLAADLAHHGGAGPPPRAFVFLDACYSGGIVAELVHNLPAVVGTTTCSRNGYGYDDASNCSGAWTHTFLTCGLAPRRRENTDLVAVFKAAKAQYVRRFPNAGDQPAFFGRTPDGRVRVDSEADPGVPLPERVFMTRDWLLGGSR